MHWSLQVVEAVIKTVVILFGLAFPLASILTWQERKQSALIQDRIGPNRAYIPVKGLKKYRFWGLLHLVADSVKMFFKEDFRPRQGNRFLIELAPILALAPVLIMFAVIPFGDTLLIYMPSLGKFYESNLTVAPLNTGILFIFAIAALTVYGSVLAGYAPESKPGMLGSMRASAQMFSYEVTLGLTLVGIMMIYGTVRLDDIARAQDALLFGFLPAWGIVYQPVGFFLYVAAATAETKRIPFDLPEGESEIVGYFVEYSGMKFATFMLAEFIEVVALSTLLTVLFFGAYHIPWLSWRMDVIPWLTGIIGADTVIPVLQFQAVTFITAILQFLVFAIKVAFFCFMQLTVRWTLPRFRYDQLMNFGWKLLLPLSMANLAITAVIVLIVDSI